jgi:hypothetical protein
MPQFCGLAEPHLCGLRMVSVRTNVRDNIYIGGFVVALLLVGCQQHEASQGSHVTATSTAVLNEEGNVRTRAPTQVEFAAVKASAEKLREIDRQFPRPAIPARISPAKATRMLPRAAIELTDGRAVRLDGIRCSPIGLKHLSRLILDPNVSLLVVPTGPASEQVVPAEVWTAETLDDGLVTYSLPAESALTSGWCDVEPTATSRHNDRYAALVAAFRGEHHQEDDAAP